jgi:type II secretory pathway pseudopilin PulG
MKQLRSCHVTSQKGFSLIEVVLAIGIFLVTVLALVGLLGPTLQSVDEVEKTDEVSSIVNTINAFLQNSPEIAPGASRFNAIYNAVSQDSATLLVFRAYDANDVISLKVGFVGETDQLARVSDSDVTDGSEVFAAGTIYRAVLTPSSVNPVDERADAGVDSYPRYRMNNATPATYPEGSFAMEVRIFAEDPSLSFDDVSNLNTLKDQGPIFTYNTAIVR